MSGRLQINLAAVAHNYRVLRAGNGQNLAAVVKADAYGLGANEVATALWAEGCREFFVAQAAEGVALRSTLPEAQIYVLEGVSSSSLATLRTQNLCPVLNSVEQCVLWSPSDLPAALQLDTGMARLGLSAEEIALVLRDHAIDVRLLLSHFARADELEHDFTQSQTDGVMVVYTELLQRWPELRLSLHNSAACIGVASLPARIQQLGRAGIGLYGGNPLATGSAGDVGLRPVASVFGQVLQVRNLKAGTPVGYGGTYIATADERIMIVGVGYADGVPRLLSNQGHVFVQGQHCAIRGRVSMDMLHADASEVDVAVGDWVEVMGANICVDDIAVQAQTIPYEVLTGLGKRLHRVYLNDSEAGR